MLSPSIHSFLYKILHKHLNTITSLPSKIPQSYFCPISTWLCKIMLSYHFPQHYLACQYFFSVSLTHFAKYNHNPLEHLSISANYTISFANGLVTNNYPVPYSFSLSLVLYSGFHFSLTTICINTEEPGWDHALCFTPTPIPKFIVNLLLCTVRLACLFRRPDYFNL